MRYYQIVVSEPKSGRIWRPTDTGALVLSGKRGTTSPGSAPLQGNVTTDAASGLQVVTVPGRTLPLYTFTSHPNGNLAPPDPGALNIEFDCTVVPEHTPQGGTLIRVHGVGLDMIGQAANLTGQEIELRGGMGKGLPLANPAQAGVLMQGTIFQAFGNWEGTDQTLDLICNPGGTYPDNGVIFDWQPDSDLETALRTTLAQAFPKYQVNMNIAIGSLTPPRAHPQQGCYQSLTSFSSYLNQITQPLGAQLNLTNYPGVHIVRNNKTINVYDYSTPRKTVAINFQDFVGQPTWISAASIGFKTVLRADILPGDQVKFPQGILSPFALTAPTAAVPNAPSRSKIAFQGSFVVQEVHHFANFRQPEAVAWNTSFLATSSASLQGVSLMGAFPGL